jgi:tRNA A-37 threonylcarbamoyl transferase component Bud32
MTNRKLGYIGECLEMAEKVGKAIGMMHDKDVGKVMTSNYLVTTFL